MSVSIRSSVFRYLIVNFRKASTKWILVLLASLLFGSYWIYRHLGEVSLTKDLVQYLYFSVVTMTTVGYGDASPQTDGGKLYSILVFIPVSILVFGALATKLVDAVIHFRQKRISGDVNVNYENFILIIGWNANTRRLIEHSLADSKRLPSQIVLADATLSSHPMIGYPEVEFVSLNEYSMQDIDRKLNVIKAAKVVVMGRDDEESFLISVALTALDVSAHTSVYFSSCNKADVLKTINPNIEISCDRVSEMLTRSMQDHGSSVVVNKLLDIENGPTMMMLPIVTDENSIDLGKLRSMLWKVHRATLIGISESDTGDDVQLNPLDSVTIKGKWYIHYIGSSRIGDQISSHLYLGDETLTLRS
ncbi:potassium channel family protein [Vibrio splendidus]